MTEPSAAERAGGWPVRERVVVVGAGMVGVASALWALRPGREVVLVDREAPGHGASWGNAGIFSSGGCIPITSPTLPLRVPRMLLRPESPLRIEPAYLPRLLPWLVRLLANCAPWRVRATVNGLARLLRAAEGGFMPLVRRAGLTGLLGERGTLYLYPGEGSWRAEQWAREERRRQGIDFEELDGAAIRELEPALAPSFFRGLRFRDAFHLRDPARIVEGLAGAFVQWGGRLRRLPVRQIDNRVPGRLEVHCAGETLLADRVVLAAGAWSTRVLPSHLPERLPLETERGYHVMFPGGEALLRQPLSVAGTGYYLTPMEQGLRVAGTVELAGLDAPPTPERVRVLESGARRLLPQLGEAGSSWLGFRPSLPDGLPAIGPLPSEPRILCAFGHQHLGMTLGGITGRIVAAMLNGEPLPVDVTPYRPERFT